MTGRVWHLVDLGRPITENEHRTMHFRARSAYDRRIRNTFWALAKEARIPPLSAIAVTVRPEVVKGRLADVGACYPWAKAAIDGLVDAGVIPDDDPAHHLTLTFHAPVRTGRDAVVLIVEELDAG